MICERIFTSYRYLKKVVIKDEYMSQIPKVTEFRALNLVPSLQT